MNLLFDLDGTLTDPAPGIVGCIRHALIKLDRDPDEHANLERFIGPPLLASFTELIGNEQESQLALTLYRERFGSVGLYENEVYDGIESTLELLLGAGHRLIVATSKPRVYAQKIIDHFGLAKYFEQVYGSELSGERSDKAELISFLLNREGLEPGATTMIGDRRHDILGAKANNIRSIGVLWGYGSQDELIGAGADILCESPAKLVRYIAKSVTTRSL